MKILFEIIRFSKTNMIIELQQNIIVSYITSLLWFTVHLNGKFLHERMLFLSHYINNIFWQIHVCIIYILCKYVNILSNINCISNNHFFFFSTNNMQSRYRPNRLWKTSRSTATRIWRWCGKFEYSLIIVINFKIDIK